MRPNAARVLEYVHSRQPLLTGLIRELVEAESPSAHPETHDEVRRILRLALADAGLESREAGSHAGEPRHVFARPAQRERGKPIQLIVGHFDTVWPIGTIEKRPFRIDGNVVHGPGSFDMKGGLAQLVVALHAIRDLELPMTVAPVVFVNADEEIGSRSSTRFIRMLARRASRAYVLEPALGERGDVKTARKGIGRFTVTVYGKAAHAGLDPESGASAILELSHVIQKLFALNDVERGITVNVGTVDGGIQPNVVAPHSSAVVDVRVPTIAAGNEIEYIIHSIKATTPNVRLHIEGAIGRPSMEHTPRNRKLWEHVKATGEDLGIELHEARAGGGSDGNTTSQFTATVDGLGPVGDGAHAVHEHLLVDKTLERAALLTMLLTAPEVS
ncbi:MAG: M20 family metallopeptidase [Gammaproteobacteria bacterium]|nr:M20 family metallopeptidase [Gammaproteobacteria bacterium]NNF50465.1 M20 family metallopeptidase [Woeseiaceae bacterium]MBT8093403.1 M20 family metallopeptidase [Gammaproteobacteria bacterium]MBT8106197.1 M20 family metallopeptidase [Gammaproteobacteria bacterium]NNK26211.1 M20 family metallopeptidase [Woeseiaceae bacterium]